MAIPDALSRHYVTYMADEPEAGNDLLGSLFDSALKYKNNIKIGASTSFTFVVSLNKQQIVNCDRANNYGRPELFVSDFSARAARFGR